jgi:hypothetical protein
MAATSWTDEADEADEQASGATGDGCPDREFAMEPIDRIRAPP